MRLLIALILSATTVGVAESSDAFTYEVFYAFAGGADGGVPAAGLVSDSAGNLYGTTEFRGTSDWGVVFKLDANGNESVLHSFTGGAEADGSTPRAALILDSDGNLYGTALQGGTGCGGFTCGVVFKIDSTGHESLLHSFDGTDGQSPEAGLLRDSAGKLYGTTSAGGSGYGVVFSLDTTGKETVLYSFTGAADGAQPLGGLIADSAGNFYGTTQTGGDFSACTADGCGVVFKLDPTTGKETVLYTFTGGADGRYPQGDLIEDSAGNLYGMTEGGGGCISGGGCGVVFKVDPLTGMETVLYTFTGDVDGGHPSKAGLFIDEAGILYGTTALGGASGGCGGGGCGVIFQLDPTSGQQTVLYTFTGGADGGQPTAGLIRDSTGNFYGTASTAGISGNCGIGCGVVFKLTAGGESPNITSVAPPEGKVGTPYTHVYAASGAVPINYSVTMGALPTGLALSASGRIDGTPTTAGTFEGTVTASNGISPDATQTFSIRVTSVGAGGGSNGGGGGGALELLGVAFLLLLGRVTTEARR